jgi:hypothetical protein
MSRQRQIYSRMPAEVSNRQQTLVRPTRPIKHVLSSSVLKRSHGCCAGSFSNAIVAGAPLSFESILGEVEGTRWLSGCFGGFKLFFVLLAFY